MKLRFVSASNIKGSSFNYQLSDATAIIGKNFSHKTAIVEAIRLALMGYIPEIGKRPSSTWELSSGPEMTVHVGFDNEDEISRRFWLEGGTVKIAAHREGPGLVTEFESLPLLNAEAYFQMTDSERVSYVFSRIKLPDGYTPKAIIAECERLSLEEAHTEQVQKAKGAILHTIGVFFSPDISIQNALVEAIDSLRDKFTYWNKRAKDTQGAVTTLAELKLREKTVAAAARGVDEVLEKTSAELDRLNVEKGRLEAKQDEAERTAARKKAIRKMLDADRTDYPRMIEKLCKQIAAEKERLGPELDAKARKNLLDAISESRKRHAEVAGATKAAKTALVTAERSMDALSELECCPYCMSKGKDWKANLERKLNETINESTERLDVGSAQLEALNGSIAKMEKSLDEFDAIARANMKIRDNVFGFEMGIKSHENSLANEERRRTELKEELAALEILPEEKDLSEELRANTNARNDAAELHNSAKASKDDETRLQQDLRRAAEAEIEHQDAKAHVLVIKTLANLLKEKREAMIDEAFTGLLATANKLTDGILKRQLALFDGTIGMWDGGKFIPHRVFSGTEKALAYIAIAVALSSTAPLRLVILDEFGRLDEDNQYKVLLRLGILVADGVIDQFIVVGTSLPPQLETSHLHLEVIRV